MVLFGRMRFRDFAAIFFASLSLVFSFLTLLSGYKSGVIEDAAILTYSVKGFAPPGYAAASQFDHYWYSLHYLSTCRGTNYNGGPTKYIPILNYTSCTSRMGGYSFRLDSSVIGNDNVSSPGLFENGASPYDEISLAGPFATLILGMIFSFAYIGCFFWSLFLAGKGGKQWIVGIASVAAAFLVASSGSILALILRTQTPGNGYNWIRHDTEISGFGEFIAFTWTGTIFMMLCDCLAIWDFIVWRRSGAPAQFDLVERAEHESESNGPPPPYIAVSQK